MRKGKFIIKNIVKSFFILLFTYLVIGFLSTIPISKSNTSIMPDTTLLKLSEDLLYNVKIKDSTTAIENALANLSTQKLIDGLNNDKAIKTFWINMYNAWYQILATREKMIRPDIFKGKYIKVAQHLFSLDDIEHGILRKYRWKYSKGYLPKFFPGKLIKQLAVATIDYRIHFALNCGAKSCPPIAFYSYENIEQQLSMATKSFLENETVINDNKKGIQVTSIMDWFMADFGGKAGIKKIVQEVFKKDVTNYAVTFDTYNWDAALDNFK